MPTSVSLTPVLATIRKRIAQAGRKGLNEQDTKATLIEPMLRALGWDTEDVEQVQREYRVKRQHKPVDYGLLANRTPRLLVEAKGLGQHLDDHKWAGQIMGYAAVAGVEWVVLTDGDEYRIYNSHATVAVEEKLLRSVRISSGEPQVEATLDLLSKARLEENRLDVLWRAHFVDRAVKAAVEDLFTSDNDLVLVNHILRATPKLTADEVRVSLRRCRHQFDFPVSPDDVLASVKGAAKPAKAPRPTPHFLDVSLADLINSGHLKAPVALSCKYQGKEVCARVLPDGRVEWKGRTFDSLSQAGTEARAAIGGLRPDGKKRATNGWVFWKYQAPDGELRDVDHARRQYLAAKNPSAAAQKARTG
ncbi:MAG TPA: type I restriction enzyme HsdR N-terminal domain-containing protein [Planctomycetota bacterium]|nr:type I restriction enzyme HsdR N-terminal domain-containing protein [Planctomycetota bacterium]